MPNMSRIKSMKLDALIKRATINEEIKNGQPAVLSDLQMIAQQNNIAITIIGGIAVQNYGYDRFTDDADILVKAQSAKTLGDALLALKYEFIGGNKFKHSSGFKVNICADSVRAKGLNFISPTASNGELDVIPLPNLLAMKIEANRYKDCADFVELIKANGLNIA